MSADEHDYTKWMCGRAGMVGLQRVGSLVRDIGEPCLHPSPAKGSRVLKPEKWQTAFDSDGRVIGFRKALKLIVLGGVDPSIRKEVWEFLLGCYSLSSTSEDRRHLRNVRRERYDFLIKECQAMHSSIGTGKLAYAVGSRLMDVRTTATIDNQDTSEPIYMKSNLGAEDLGNSKPIYDSPKFLHSDRRGSSSKSAEPVIFNPVYDSYDLFSSEVHYSPQRDSVHVIDEPKFDTETFLDFASLPMTNLFWKGDTDVNEFEKRGSNFSAPEDRLRYRDDHMHSFQIGNNIDLIMESANPRVRPSNSDTAIFHSDAYKHDLWLGDIGHEREIIDTLRVSDARGAEMVAGTKSDGSPVNKDRVSEWLWTLHRIVVDVVRTDSHLEFYGDPKNMARMADILAVYAWVDPSTGYCQGMSDLLSPFVVLYDDDADAFWCFEMLLRRLRENFLVEGPTGVMKQLQALWKIVEMTDSELFEHLSVIGAESLHFAFRMLLVLFRRELSFEEALCMWEMMWAADFDEDVNRQLEQSCLQPLVLDVNSNSYSEIKPEQIVSTKRKSKSMYSCCKNGEIHGTYGHYQRSSTRNPLCGLSAASLWAKSLQLHLYSTTASLKNGDELSIFCVAAILIINRHKIMRETRSIDDAIKMFNDNLLKIKVKRCIRLAIKLRKKYFYKVLKGSPEQ